MRKLIYALVLISISVLYFQCQKEVSNIGGGPNGGGGNNTSAPLTATLQGNIVDENGSPASGVTIHVGSKSAVTDSKGYFRVTNASLDKNSSVVTAEKAGYFKAYRSFRATSGVNQVVIKLIKKTVAGTVSATAGGDVTLANGTKVTLPANGIVKASGGAAYSGTVNVYTAYIDPTASDINSTVPGSFMADDKNGNRVTLASFGMLAVELESTSGEKLQIATGSKATLTAPIPSSLLSSAPATIALWYVDEQTGIWREEGTATKTGNNYVGDVKHFSFWNCDISIPTVNLSLTLKNTEGGPIVYGWVRITRQTQSGMFQAHGWTDSLGQVSGLVPANETLLLEVLAYPCGNVVYSQNIGPFSTNTNLGTITVTSTTSQMLTIKGKLVNCSAQPVTDGYAMIYYDNMVRYATTDNNGNFECAFLVCSGGAANFDILGIDEAAQQQGSITTLATVTPVTNTGNITACGTSSAQYINFTLDGNSFSLTSPPDSTLFGYTYPTQSTPPSSSFIYGTNSTADIMFGFRHNNTTGSFPITLLDVQSYDSTVTFVQPFNIVVTSNPSAPGGFYEGSFNGQFTHPSTGSALHSINATFRVRRQQ